MDLFKLVATLGLDSSDYERGISKARSTFDSLGSSISAKTVAMGQLIARGVERAVDAAVDLGRSAVQNAADVVAERAQFTATFDLLQGEAEKAFDAIEKSTGIFGTRLQKVGTKAFSQFKGAGLDGVEALSMMEDYTNLAADAAAYYDITLEQADERLRSFLRGNTEAGDAIGLFTSESQRNSAAMEKYGQKWAKLTEAQKQMLMLDISKDIYKQSGAIGQASRESDAWTNVIGNLKEAWRQASGALGEPIMATLTPVLQDVTAWLNKPEVQTKIEQFGLGVGDAINWLLDPTFPTWEELKDGASTKIAEIIAGVESVANWTLGQFDMPPVDTIVADVTSWWTGQGDNAYERVKSVLSWTFGEFVAPALDQVDKWWNGEGGGEDALLGLLGWTFGEFFAPAVMDIITSTGQTLGEWASEFIGGVVDLLDWGLGELNLPTVTDVVKQIQGWWSLVTSQLKLFYNAYFRVNSNVNTGREQRIKEATEDYLGPYGNGWGDDYSFEPQGNAGGMYYTKNNYIARLHEGEAILNSREAAAWRSGTGSSSPAAIGAAVADAIAQALDGAFVDMDGEHVGNLVTQRVSRNIAAAAKTGRYNPAW